MNDEEQRLAITVAGLPLLGGALIGQRLIGTWATFAVGAGVFVGAYVTPLVLREPAVRRLSQRLRQWSGWALHQAGHLRG
ncbi:hypothetical protein QZH56_16185 [Streptomyces olivoreticuli]|uniref:hypothetical protein n=1 Tax=Streptomyces olivoreticuli TaxID=68246 RepID=UPI00265A066F|nr:hypothetical protein [Streptomyces olivoreticuli]WKK26989.1 hypothetical protein QZH56_16185 [Streptomyces olivoreticuli]